MLKPENTKSTTLCQNFEIFWTHCPVKNANELSRTCGKNIGCFLESISLQLHAPSAICYGHYVIRLDPSFFFSFYSNFWYLTSCARFTLKKKRRSCNKFDPCTAHYRMELPIRSHESRSYTCITIFYRQSLKNAINNNLPRYLSFSLVADAKSKISYRGKTKSTRSNTRFGEFVETRIKLSE